MPVAIATAAAETTGTLPVAQAITIDCNGFTPVAVLVLATRSVTLGTIADGAMYSAGWTDGTTTRLASAMSEDGQAAASADTGIDYDNDGTIVRILATGSEATDGRATFVSLSNNVLNIEWSDLPATAVQLMVYAFYGAGWQARTGAVACSTILNGTVTTTGTVFRPAGLISIAARAGFTSSGANADIHIGFCGLNPDGTVQGQGAYGLREGDRSALTSAFSGVRNDCIGFRTTLIAEEARYEVTAGTADGFTITTRVAGGFAYALGFIALNPNGQRITAGSVDLGTAATGVKSVAVNGYAGSFFLLGTALSSVNSYSGAAPCANWSLGLATRFGSGHVGYQASANAVTSDTRCLASTTGLVRIIADDGSADWAASLTSFGLSPDSVLVDITSASVANRHSIFMAIEEPVGKGWLDARSGHRWRRCLARR